ncbi:MAG: CRISPR-associated endonuclease Cas2 [Candidatus Zixiibacteriota bacterium]
MLLWAIYDIRSDKARRKVARACKKMGLYRVQKSVFLGQIEPNRFDELCLISEKLISPNHDSVYLFPMCQKDFNKVITIGQAFDEKLVTDEIRELFL